MRNDLRVGSDKMAGMKLRREYTAPLRARIAELEERVAALELDAGHAINAIDRGDVADARGVLVSALKNMFRE